MHWLSSEIERVGKLAASRSPIFLGALRDLIAQLGARPGLRAAFAAHEGLIVAVAGDGPAAEAQGLLGASLHASAALGLGDVQQLVVVTAQGKLALLSVGPVVVGLLAPPHVSLAVATASSA
jgi:predicted regulator of Ras-like GTPase activity (Roadblock/LC7/MglB family)